MAFVGKPGKFVDGAREVVPRANALVREVIDTGAHALIDGRHDSLRKVAGIGRRADLVENHAQFLAFLSEAQHRLDEVVAEGGVEPRRADNHRARAVADNGFLAGEFRAAVNGVGAGVVGLGIGAAGSAVENVVGRNLYHRCADSLGGICEIFGRSVVKQFAEFRLALGLIYCGECGAVDNMADAVHFNKRKYGLTVGDVEFFLVGKEKLAGICILRRKHLQLVAELSFATCYKNVFHCVYIYNIVCSLKTPKVLPCL